MSASSVRRGAMVFLLLGFAVVVWLGVRDIERGRAELVERYGDEWLRSLEAVAREVEEDFADVVEDLRFASQLVSELPTRDEQRRILGTLLATVGAYHLAVLQDAHGQRLAVADPRRKAAALLLPEVETLLEGVVAGARRELASKVVISPSFAHEGHWYRLFAMPLRSPQTDRSTLLALLVDTTSLLGKLTLAVSDPNTQLLVIGPHGKVVPLTSPGLREAMQGDARALRPLVERMRQGAVGTLRLPLRSSPSPSPTPAFGATDSIAAYTTIDVAGGQGWSVATLTSLAVLSKHEEGVIWRAVFIALLVASMLAGLALYVVHAAKNASALRERLRHAGEVARLNEKARKVLDSIPTSVLVLDAHYRVVDTNRAFAERWPGVAPGVSLVDVFGAGDLAVRLASVLDDACSHHAQRSLPSERVVTADQVGCYAFHAVPLTPGSADATVLLVLDDLTDVKDLESQLLQAEKLTTVGVLAAGIAHEIGTPLGIVRGRAEYAARKIGHEHVVAMSLSVIVEQIDHIARTIRELLDFSRPRVVHCQRVDLEALARKSTELLRFEAERRGIAVVVELPEGIPQVEADVDQLQQVFVNLLMNALDACSRGGGIRIGGFAATRDQDGERGVVRWFVEDDGCGIPAADLRRVLDPFFTTKKRGHGTGLGLAVVTRIARSHGAKLELESTPGVGTRVSLEWPVASAAEAHHDYAA